MDAVLHEDDYLATSEGFKLPSLKSFRKSQGKLARISKRKSGAKKGSKSRRKLAKCEARIHQQIARARKDHSYNTAHALLKTGKKVFFHEKLNLAGLSRRNKAKRGGLGGFPHEPSLQEAKQDESGKYLPNGQSAKSGLNKSWTDAAFGIFFNILKFKATSRFEWEASHSKADCEKAGALVIPVNPQYTSQLLPYKDEFVFTDCGIREYWDEEYQLLVDRDISAGINIKRVGLGLYPTLIRRKGKAVIGSSVTNSTLKEVLTALRGFQKPALYA